MSDINYSKEISVNGNEDGCSCDQDSYKNYTCYRAAGPISIDGSLMENSWQVAEKLPCFMDRATENPIPPNNRSAILWDDKNMYFAFWIQAPDVLATFTHRDSLRRNKNGVEVFISGQDCYYEYKINAVGTVFECFWVWQDAYKRGSRFDIPELDLQSQKVEVLGGNNNYIAHPHASHWGFRKRVLKGIKSEVKINGPLHKKDDRFDGWTVELAFPWLGMKLLAGDKPLPPCDGDIWRINLSRFENYMNRDSHINPGWLWNTNDNYDSHIPERFTYIHFSSKIVGEI